MQTAPTKRSVRAQNAGRWEYRFYMILLLPFAFFTVLLQTIWPGRRSTYVSVEDHSPFLSEVIELCRSAVPWVFMGR
ncbi:MAG: hypothetical protein AAF830_12565 [Pseudomonadota bacterium]